MSVFDGLISSSFMKYLKYEYKTQAGAELCQAQGQFGLAWFSIGLAIFLRVIEDLLETYLNTRFEVL